jgi:hypothetical protein
VRKLIKKINFFWVTLLVLMIARFLYFGLKYFPIIDDNNIYGVYNLRLPDIWNNIILHYHLYAIRPIAYMIVDPILIAPVWHYMIAVLLVITFLHLVSCYLLQNILTKLNIKFGEFAVLVFALAPFNVEAVYWISASSRIIVGLFICLLSIYWLLKYIENRDKKILCFAFIFNLIAMGFYEQIIVFNFFLACLVIFIKRKEIKNKLLFGMPFLNVSVIIIYYAYFIAIYPEFARAETRTIDYFTQAHRVLQSIYDYTIFKQFYALIDGFKDGSKIIIHNNSFIYVIFIILLSIILYASFKKGKIALLLSKDSITDSMKHFVVGLIFFAVPFSIFFVLNYYYIYNRNIFLPMIGITIICEMIFNIVFNVPILKKFKGIFIILTVMVFMITNIAEINNYKKINETDNAICKDIITCIGEENIKTNNSLFVLNTRDNYVKVTDQSVSSSCSSDWGLMGLMQVQLNKVAKMQIYCTQNNQDVTYVLNAANIYFVGIDENNSVLKLFGVANNQDILLNQQDGQRFGILKSISNNKYTFERG